LAQIDELPVLEAEQGLRPHWRRTEPRVRVNEAAGGREGDRSMTPVCAS
jgi:hypothetical protein